MSKINAISLKNLRCFRDSGFINLKPITILVGKNSAGKSTFARLFPLLRQSAEEDKKAPILWYGKLVDFGSFETALNKNAEIKEISLGFKFDLKNNFVSSLFKASTTTAFFYTSEKSKEEVPITVELNLRSNASTTYASSIKINLFNTNCEIYFEDANKLESIVIDGQIKNLMDGYTCYITQRHIVPSLFYVKSVKPKSSESKEQTRLYAGSPFGRAVFNKIQQSINKNTSKNKIMEIAKSIKLGSNETIINSLVNSPRASYAASQEFSVRCQRENFIKELKSDLFADALPSIFEEIDNFLNNYSRGVRYIEPLRASAQRYYRGQDLAVDEVDSKGTNVAMFIDSLSYAERARLNEWLKEFFNVEVNSRREGGHISVEIKVGENGKETNLADLGVGFSQLLPIVLQTWQAASSKRSSKKSNGDICIVIEQPELHLHPAYQAKIADLLAATIKALDKNNSGSLSVQVIAETHSPHLVSRLGELISDGKLEPDDVQLIMFEDNESNGENTVTMSSFDDDGVLQNWPYGFFEP